MRVHLILFVFIFLCRSYNAGLLLILNITIILFQLRTTVVQLKLLLCLVSVPPLV